MFENLGVLKSKYLIFTIDEYQKHGFIKVGEKKSAISETSALSIFPTLRGLFGTCQNVGLKTSINFNSNLYLQGLQQGWACVLLLHFYCHYLEMIRSQSLIGQHLPVFYTIKQNFNNVISGTLPPNFKMTFFGQNWFTSLPSEWSSIVYNCLTMPMRLKLLQTWNHEFASPTGALASLCHCVSSQK